VLTNTDGIQIEKVAAQRPDLILGVYSGITQKEYDALSKLAPVVAQPKDKVDFGSTWQQEQLTAGKAVGQAEEAQQLVDETEQLIADTAAKYPQFKGKTAAEITDYQGIFVYGPQDVRTQTLESLGFVFPPALAKAFPDEFGGNLSEEKLDALDVDALVWLADGDRSVEDLKSDPVYSKLNVRKQARDVFILLKDRVYEALSFPSVLSMSLLMRSSRRAWPRPWTATRAPRRTSRPTKRASDWSGEPESPPRGGVDRRPDGADGAVQPGREHHRGRRADPVHQPRQAAGGDAQAGQGLQAAADLHLLLQQGERGVAATGRRSVRKGRP